MAIYGVKARIRAISQLDGLRFPRAPSYCRKFSNTFAKSTRLYEYVCDVDAEPLHRYKNGGYHPVHLGDVLNEGRYKILHKLGWGGYATVWAARDQKEHTYVAVKILVAEQRCRTRELTALRTLTAARSDQPGYQHLMMMQDFFQLEGPNGTHDCLVLEMLGPNVADFIDAYAFKYRYPGKVANSIARGTLLGLCYLHERGIAHGDLHTRNVAFTVPSIQALREQDFLQKLGKPDMSPIERVDKAPLEPGMPRYLVMPTVYPKDHESGFGPVKIIDFGQCFSSKDTPPEFHTPISVRPPEVVFRDIVDHRMDLWSMGCMLFELVTRQLPFDNILQTPSGLIAQMLERTKEDLPHRWQETWRLMCIERQAKREKWRTTYSPSPEEECTYTLQEWLQEMYFDTDQTVDLSQKDILQIGALIGRMLRFEPSARASARDLLQDSWFQRD